MGSNSICRSEPRRYQACCSEIAPLSPRPQLISPQFRPGATSALSFQRGFLPAPTQTSQAPFSQILNIEQISPASAASAANFQPADPLVVYAAAHRFSGSCFRPEALVPPPILLVLHFPPPQLHASPTLVLAGSGNRLQSLFKGGHFFSAAECGRERVCSRTGRVY